MNVKVFPHPLSDSLQRRKTARPFVGVSFSRRLRALITLLKRQSGRSAPSTGGWLAEKACFRGIVVRRALFVNKADFLLAAPSSSVRFFVSSLLKADLHLQFFFCVRSFARELCLRGNQRRRLNGTGGVKKDYAKSLVTWHSEAVMRAGDAVVVCRLLPDGKSLPRVLTALWATGRDFGVAESPDAVAAGRWEDCRKQTNLWTS